MGDKTGISWTDASWNATKGCSRTIAAGAKQSGCGDGTGGGCYAEAQAGRIVRMAKGKPCAYNRLVRLTAKGYRWTGKVVLDPKALALPLRWKKPRRIFVNSMSDLFHEELTNEQIAAVFGVMAAAPQHTFQVLTKRAKRMREWFEWIARQAEDDGGAWTTCLRETCSSLVDERITEQLVEDGIARDGAFPSREPWPLPNVWLGVSVENQDAADERIPELLETPAAIRFLSCEPLLGQVDVSEYFDPCSVPCGEEAWPQLDWVIAGCESGPGARPCSVEWLRSLRDQCAAADVAFFLKQAVEDGTIFGDMEGECTVLAGDGSKRKPGGVIELPYLDGVQHAAFPEVSL